MRIAIHQPQYIPWPGYFAKILSSDIFVFYDDVQYSKNSIMNRNEILVNGQKQYLTVPVRKGALKDRINEKMTADGDWKVKHLKTIENAYRKHPFGREVLRLFESAFEGTTGSIAELNISLTTLICSYLGIDTEMVISSRLDIHDEDPTMRIVMIVKALCGNEYISGTGGLNYLVREHFDKNCIKLRCFRFNEMSYCQHRVENNVTGLSIVDLIANCDKTHVIKYLRANWEEVPVET